MVALQTIKVRVGKGLILPQNSADALPTINWFPDPKDELQKVILLRALIFPPRAPPL